MPQLCKKHGKPRTVIYERKMPKGGIFSIVGCADCAAAARESIEKPGKKPERKPPVASSKVRRY